MARKKGPGFLLITFLTLGSLPTSINFHHQQPYSRPGLEQPLGTSALRPHLLFNQTPQKQSKRPLTRRAPFLVRWTGMGYPRSFRTSS